MSDATVGPDTTSFSVRGVRNGSAVSVTWVEGTLGGDPPTVDLIELEDELGTVGDLDPFARRSREGDAAVSGSLSDPVHALAVIRQVIDRVTEISRP